MNKIIKHLEKNNIKYNMLPRKELVYFEIGEYTLEILRLNNRTYQVEKYKGYPSCSPKIKGGSERMIEIIDMTLTRTKAL